MGLPTSIYLSINVAITAAATPRTAFGVPLIADDENVQASAQGTPVIGTFSSLQEMEDAGFAKWNKAYKLAKYMLRPENHVKTFKVAGLATGTNATDLGEIEASNPNWYALLTTSRVQSDIEAASIWVEGTPNAHIYICETNDAAAKAAGASVLTGLHSADVQRTGPFYRNATLQAKSILVDKVLLAGQSFETVVNGQTVTTIFGVDHNTTLAAHAVAIQALSAVVTAVGSSSGGLGALNDTILITADEPLVDLTLTGLASTGAGALGAWTQTHVTTSSNPADAAAVGRQLGQDPGTSTWAHKKLSGLVGDDLSMTEFTAVQAQNGNMYVNVGGTARTLFGTMSGESAPGTPMFIDLRILADAIKAELETALDAVLLANEKVPYTDDGIALFIAAMQGVEEKHVKTGALVKTPFAETYQYPSIDDVSAADKSARVLNGLVATYQTAGGIHVVSNVQVNLAA